jgi:four helix bundle protein
MNNEFKFPFEKLEVWHLAVDFTDFILNVLDSCQPNKYLRLVGQLEAAVSSIPQNIAEGKGRQYSNIGKSLFNSYILRKAPFSKF